MPNEAILRITEAEKNAQKRKQGAIAAAKEIVANAERIGYERFFNARQKAEQAAKACMEQALKDAAQNQDALMLKTKAACDALQKDAEGRLFQTAQLIVGKVVNT